VTPGFVAALGIHPAIGRPFTAAAFTPGGPNEAVISHRLWTTRFGGDPNVIGRSFAAYVSDRPHEAEQFTIVGVLPQGFWHFNPYVEVIAPLRAPSYPYMARLRDGVTASAASERLTPFVASGARNVRENFRVSVVPAHDAHVAQVRPIVRSAAVAAGLVMLVACANVAGLLLVRATRREREIALRAALGAGRSAIARMLLAEGLVLGGAATLVAIAASAAAVRALAPMLQQQLGRSAPGGLTAFALDWRVVGVAAAIGVVTAVICTVVPLAALLRPRLAAALQGASRGATDARRTQRMRTALMVAEVAASLTLLVGSAALVRSVVTLLRTDLGFDAERVLNAGLTLRQHRYPDAAARTAVFDRLAERIQSIPGVESLGLATAWPVQQPRIVPIEARGGGAAQSARAAAQTIGETYLGTVGIPVTAGRPFTPADRLGSEPVAIVSESLARRLWPDGTAIGRRLGVAQEQPQGPPAVVERLIVGVAGDVRQGPADDDLADVYLPMRQAPSRFAFLFVRTAGQPATAIAALRRAVREVDPDLVVQNPRPLEAIVAETTSRPRFLASLLGFFAVAAAIFALVGVYGVIAYAVRQREREIAVRLAIGADPRRIVSLFVRQGGAILAVGLAFGVLATVAAGRVIESQLIGVPARDPLAIAAAVAAFGTAGLLAVWWPARRAAATDPAIALRAE
jgi:predicted permease